MISPAFAAALAAGRPHLNARIEAARRGSAAFDAGRFTAFLARAVDPVIVAVAERDASRVAAVVTACIDAALAFGAAEPGQALRTARIGAAWGALAGPCAASIAAEPGRVLGMLANAVHHVGNGGGRTEEWCGRMAAQAARTADVAQLAALGQLLAWRAGLAHFRPGALAAADTLPESLACAALEIPAGTPWASAAAALRDDPWWGAESLRESGIEAGAFIGLGGPFMAPPAVRACDDGFLVHDGDRVHLLVADRYGAVFHPATRAEFDAAPAASAHPAVRLQGTELAIRGRTMRLDLPPDDLRATCNRHTVALSSPYTHAVRLLPLPGAQP